MADRLIDRDVTVAAGRAAAVTPSDTLDLERVTRGLYIGASGNVTVVMEIDDTQVTFVGVPAGSILPIRVRRVMSTGTTAGSIVAMA